jgi:hypothetical protein
MIVGVDNWWIDLFFLLIIWGLVINELSYDICLKDWDILFWINELMN